MTLKEQESIGVGSFVRPKSDRGIFKRNRVYRVAGVQLGGAKTIKMDVSFLMSGIEMPHHKQREFSMPQQSSDWRLAEYVEIEKEFIIQCESRGYTVGASYISPTSNTMYQIKAGDAVEVLPYNDMVSVCMSRATGRVYINETNQWAKITGQVEHPEAPQEVGLWSYCDGNDRVLGFKPFTNYKAKKKEGFEDMWQVERLGKWSQVLRVGDTNLGSVGHKNKWYITKDKDEAMKRQEQRKALAKPKGNKGLVDQIKERGNIFDPNKKIKMDDKEMAVLLAMMAGKDLHNRRESEAAMTKEEIIELVNDYLISKPVANLMGRTIKEALEALGIVPQSTEVVIKKPKGKPKNMGKQHFKFPLVLQAISARANVALVGEAGSGKTTVVRKCAEALDLKFYSKSVSLQTGVHEFFGYQDANGNYIRTLFRESYEHGGVFLLDEFDAGNPNVLAALNQATANDSCAFADGMIDKHEDFIVVMAGNTFGHGANSKYVGRNKIDAATLDRFAFIQFPYDEKFEMDLAMNKAWCRKVQDIRAKVRTKKINTIVSPRATFDGSKLLEIGMDESDVMELMIFKGLSQEERELINQ